MQSMHKNTDIKERQGTHAPHGLRRGFANPITERWKFRIYASFALLEQGNSGALASFFLFRMMLSGRMLPSVVGRCEGI